jgi:hypothetical protein
MKIEDEQLYHGAALIQIAEAEHFTAINRLTAGGMDLKSVYKINKDIGVFLKYASQPRSRHDEYVFNFSLENRKELSILRTVVRHIFVALICVESRQICCVTSAEIEALFQTRRTARGYDEEIVSILCSLPSGKAFRVYVNAPGKRNRLLGEPLLVARNRFPSAIFD